MAIEYTHTFELNTDNLNYQGEVDIVSGVYTENQAEELPTNLEIDLKQILEHLSKFHKSLGNLKSFELKVKK